MAMAWNNRDETFYSNHEDDKASFQRHNERMKEFRLAHLGWETGGPKYAKTVDCFALLPLRRVNPARLSQN